jgi:hypothetical protein
MLDRLTTNDGQRSPGSKSAPAKLTCCIARTGAVGGANPRGLISGQDINIYIYIKARKVTTGNDGTDPVISRGCRLMLRFFVTLFQWVDEIWPSRLYCWDGRNTKLPAWDQLSAFISLQPDLIFFPHRFDN